MLLANLRLLKGSLRWLPWVELKKAPRTQVRTMCGTSTQFWPGSAELSPTQSDWQPLAAQSQLAMTAKTKVMICRTGMHGT